MIENHPQNIYNRTGRIKTTINQKINKLRERQKINRRLKKTIVESVVRYNGNDNRPYAVVRVEDKEMTGLLDSGASVSVLGKNCRELVEEMGINMEKYYSNVKTASGQSHRVLGRVQMRVKYEKKEEIIMFYLCPDLEQQLYLGIDFWRAFNLAPDLLNVEELDIEKMQSQFAEKETPHKLDMHELSENQKGKLQEVLKNSLLLRSTV